MANLPYASFDNPRFGGKRKLHTGPIGSDHDDLDGQLSATQTLIATTRPRMNSPMTNKGIEPIIRNNGFRSTVVTQDRTIIAGKKNQEIQQNKFQGFGN